MKLLFNMLAGAVASKSCADGLDKKHITTYLENWHKPYEIPTYYTNVHYSFLTLDKRPNPDSPHNAQWDGSALYESMAQADVLEVMKNVTPAWKNNYNWQKQSIDGAIALTKKQGQNFIWAVGGWSDLTKTVSRSQVQTLANEIVELLKIGGDGVDFDWEHLSDDATQSAQQRKNLANVFLTVRETLDAHGMSDKKIGYTTRFNAFWEDGNRPQGFKAFASDGEGLDIEREMNNLANKSLSDVIDWINIMMYDTSPTDLGGKSTGLALEQYKIVLDYFAQSEYKEKIIMGFEPGFQAAGGVWEGFKVDKQVVDYIAASDFGGVMFWAQNDQNKCNTVNCEPAGATTKENTEKIAQYTYNKFHAAGQTCRPRSVPTFVNLKQLMGQVPVFTPRSAEKYVAFDRINPVKGKKRIGAAKKPLAILLI